MPADAATATPNLFTFSPRLRPFLSHGMKGDPVGRCRLYQEVVQREREELATRLRSGPSDHPSRYMATYLAAVPRARRPPAERAAIPPHWTAAVLTAAAGPGPAAAADGYDDDFEPDLEPTERDGAKPAAAAAADEDEVAADEEELARSEDEALDPQSPSSPEAEADARPAARGPGTVSQSAAGARAPPAERAHLSATATDLPSAASGPADPGRHKVGWEGRRRTDGRHEAPAGDRPRAPSSQPDPAAWPFSQQEPATPAADAAPATPAVVKELNPTLRLRRELADKYAAAAARYARPAVAAGARAVPASAPAMLAAAASGGGGLDGGPEPGGPGGWLELSFEVDGAVGWRRCASVQGRAGSRRGAAAAPGRSRSETPSAGWRAGAGSGGPLAPLSRSPLADRVGGRRAAGGRHGSPPLSTGSSLGSSVVGFGLFSGGGGGGAHWPGLERWTITAGTDSGGGGGGGGGGELLYCRREPLRPSGGSAGAASWTRVRAKRAAAELPDGPALTEG
jgi:hypothetical protein